VPVATNSRESIAKTFGQQWARFDYDRDRTWGATIGDRAASLVLDFERPAEWFAGKTFLDAGCGNGSVSAAAASLGCQVVGVDISDSVRRAAARYPDIEFICADVAKPLPVGRFDLVHCGGVLHHTANTRAAFKTLARHTNPGGFYFVWLYWEVSSRAYSVKKAIRTLPLPYRVRSAIATAFAIQGWVRGEGLSFREHRTTQHDFFTPAYRWEHTPAEVIGWYESIEMTARPTRVGRDGFGVLGHLPLGATW